MFVWLIDIWHVGTITRTSTDNDVSGFECFPLAATTLLENSMRRPVVTIEADGNIPRPSCVQLQAARLPVVFYNPFQKLHINHSKQQRATESAIDIILKRKLLL